MENRERGRTDEQFILNLRGSQVITYENLTGDFTIGQEITGDDSSATALIIDIDTLENTLTVINVDGTFQAGEVITDPVDGSADFVSISDLELTGDAILVKDYKNVLFTIASDNDADFVIKFQGSMADVCPDFGSAHSATNRWDYIQVRDVQDDSAIDGDTGITFSGTDDVRRFEIKASAYDWVCATITTYNAGRITTTCKLYDNR